MITTEPGNRSDNQAPRRTPFHSQPRLLSARQDFKWESLFEAGIILLRQREIWS